ncbi:prepilin-type N-terminal cleavage/methylation domain-containing protein [Colwellia sp. Arc7-635]|jgi:type IV fimbrial biogenesis protein FimT/type IV fimbrial biogenesis protein FimU|uniref:GspH/FimT family pseudopilin n=1 Tax=Colwellia sp. Arc7-635 TaxID=2497879 RepID=UPI000F857302|nr:GspH/FimT family pseudopilin [Colwellia sp. Arc7-635]AZQ86347.1 prepilin-type N-terminal cleavage/methylation domain-containing protein [Colwellia sp. Arc7-635]
MSVSHIKKQATKKRLKGFTITELLIGIAIVGILTAVAAPSLSQLMVQSRVDNEISEIHRLILLARNSAINSGRSVTICPLSGTSCGTNWQNELSVFINNDNTLVNNKVYDSANEELIKIKSKITAGDTLQFNQTVIIFAPTGRVSAGGNSKFSYCPKSDADLSRGIEISLSGRIYASSDTNNDNKDENRDGTAVSCINESS